MKRKNEAAWIESAGRWQINVQREGKRRTFVCSIPGKKGKIEAERKADQWLAEGIDGDNTKVSAICDQYLAQIDTSASSAHHRQQKQYIENYIRPAIGHKKIGKVTEVDLQKIIDGAYKKGLAKKTLSNIRGCISSIWRYARRAKCSGMTPELTVPINARKSSKKIMSPRDLEVLFSSDLTAWKDKVIEDFFIHAYRLSVLLGLRPGELLGLKWTDLTQDHRLHIQRSINSAYEITSGKNDNADRWIALTGLALEEVFAQRALLKTAGLDRCIWMFPAPWLGKPPCQNTYYLRFKRYQTYHKFSPIVSPYELRHTFVSINDEMPDGLKKKTMGHSRSMDTEGVYGHRKAGDLERAAQYSDDAFRRVIRGPRSEGETEPQSQK